MRIESSITLDIKVISFHLGRPAQTSGPPESCYPEEPADIEFEVCTLTGHELSESDLGETAWSELYDDVLATFEADRQEALDDAISNAWESRRDMDREPF